MCSISPLESVRTRPGHHRGNHHRREQALQDVTLVRLVHQVLPFPRVGQVFHQHQHQAITTINHNQKVARQKKMAEMRRLEAENEEREKKRHSDQIRKSGISKHSSAITTQHPPSVPTTSTESGSAVTFLANESHFRAPPKSTCHATTATSWNPATKPRSLIESSTPLDDGLPRPAG